MPARIRYATITHLKFRQLFLLVFLVAVTTTCLSYLYNNSDPGNVLDQGPAYFKVPAIRNRAGGSNSTSSKKIRNVYLLKVHKSASSTVQNILLRYGVSRSLNFVLPYTGNYLGHPDHFRKDVALPLASNSMTYNVFCHHSRFDQSGLDDVMPKDSVYLAIIRDPVAVFESSFSYYALGDLFQMTIEELLAMPSWWLAISERYMGRIGFNQITFDFGINQSDFSDNLKIKWHISNLQRSFDLVMIAEHFDESLILMKNLLNLDMQDIVYISHNVRLSNEKLHLNATMKAKVKAANHADQKIYDHFYRVFVQRLEEFGKENMDRELTALHELNSYWRAKCGAKNTEDRTKAPNAEVFHQYSDKVESITLDNFNIAFCQSLAKTELQHTIEIRKKHLSNHASYWLRFLYLIGYYNY